VKNVNVTRKNAQASGHGSMATAASAASAASASAERGGEERWARHTVRHSQTELDTDTDRRVAQAKPTGVDKVFPVTTTDKKEAIKLGAQGSGSWQAQWEDCRRCGKPIK